MATDKTGTIYVGRVKITENTSGYEEGSDQADPAGWRDQFDTRRLKPPYTLYLRQTDVGSAVTTVGLQGKLQHTCLLPSEEGLGGLAKTAIPSTAWKDAEENTTAIETTALTGVGTETSPSLTEPLGQLGRVLIKVTSAGWQTGIYVDVWLKGTTV